MDALNRLARLLRADHPRWAFVAVPIAAILLALTGYLVLPDTDDPAADTVRAYLSAVRDGDVAAARGFATDFDEYSLDDETDTRFLTEAALNSDWSIESARSTGPVSDESHTAYVTTKLATPDGETAEHVFRLENGEDGWRILDPYVAIQFQQTPLGYLDVNGDRETVDRDKDDGIYENMSGKYLLFPGVYRFYESAPDIVDVDTEPVLLTPGEHLMVDDYDQRIYQPRVLDQPAFSLSKSGRRLARELVRDHIDDCAKTTKTIKRGCPFGAEYVLIPDKPGYAYDEESISDVKWKVLDYPVITTVATGTAFAVADRSPGRVKLSATGVEDGVTAESTAECDILDSKLNLEITADDELRLFVDGGRTNTEDLDPDPFNWNTCPR